MNYLKNTVKVLFMTCVLCVSVKATAQNFTYGAKAGVNIPTLKISDDSSKSILGVHLGVFGNYAINEKFAIQPELFFSTSGSKYTYNLSNTVGDINTGMRASAAMEVDDKIKASHISLPVMLQYKITNGLYIEAGPQYNLLLSIKEDYDGGGYEDIKEAYKSGTFGLGVGVGYDLATLAAGLKIGLRYTADLSDMNKDELVGGNLKSSMFQVSLAYAFGK